MEQASKKFICIVDESKLVDGLGGSKGDCVLLMMHVCVNDSQLLQLQAVVCDQVLLLFTQLSSCKES